MEAFDVHTVFTRAIETGGSSIMSEHKEQSYQSFLLRCWRTSSPDSGGIATWRFALRTVAEEPVELRFADLDKLMGYISAEFDTSTNCKRIEEMQNLHRRNEE